MSYGIRTPSEPPANTRKDRGMTFVKSGESISSHAEPLRVGWWDKLHRRYGVLERQTQTLTALQMALRELNESENRYYDRGAALAGKIAAEIVVNCEQIWELSGPGEGGIDAPAE